MLERRNSFYKFIFLQATSWGINNSFEIGKEGSESMEITTDSSTYEINYLAKIGGDLIQFRCTRNWERYRAYWRKGGVVYTAYFGQRNFKVTSCASNLCSNDQASICS